MNTSYEDSLIQLRFLGPSLENRSVPIYDLSQSLIALQRSIHFTYAVLKDDPSSNYMFPKEMRANLALQICGQKKASDGYGLIPIITGDNLEVFKDTVGFCISILGCYSRHLTLDEIRNTTVTLPSGVLITGNKMMMGVAACFNQVYQFGQRISGIGGICETEIQSGDDQIKQGAKFDDSTKGYIKALTDVEALGDPIWVYGVVDVIYPQTQIVKIKTTKGQSIVIYADDIGIKEIKEDPRRTVIIECYGEPRFKFGMESKFFDRIHAMHINVLEMSSIDELNKYIASKEEKQT